MNNKEFNFIVIIIIILISLSLFPSLKCLIVSLEIPFRLMQNL